MDDLTVVLYEPQNDINIGSVVRACQNFGVADLRLVRPRVADRAQVLISAPNAADAVDAMRRFDDLDSALADCVRVFGTTARAREATRVVADPVQAATLASTSTGRVALLFGREDHGLPNHALDRCDVQLTIPTAPEYKSLNLAQAVLLVLWENFRLRELGHAAQTAQPELRSDFDPAPRQQIEKMFEQAEHALKSVEFFKYDNPEHVMRSIRSVFNRARLDRRELAIWFGVFKEIPAFLKRRQRME